MDLVRNAVAAFLRSMRLLSQSLSALEFRQVPIKGAEWHMTRLPRDFQDEAVRKTQCRSLAKVFYRSNDGIRVLECQMLVVEQHVDRRCDFCWATLVHGRQNPRGFGEHEMRHPGTALDEALSRCDLLDVVACDQANHDIRVNGPHGAS